MGKRTIALLILSMLTKQRFRDFYEGDFDDFLTGEDNAKSEEEILRQIERLIPLE